MSEVYTIRSVHRVARNLLSRLAILAVLLCTYGLASAQNSDLKVVGVVLDDAKGEPIPGVTILVKGTKQGTITDLNGEFTLNAKTGDILRISFLGYEQQDVTASSSKLTVRLKEDNKALNEVVVIGYGSVKRKDVTGSISSVKGDDLKKMQPVTVDQALQGKVPGLVVMQTSGQPGGGVSIQIRGLSSFSGGNPLYVIDGMIISSPANLGSGTNPLAGISTSDIESIDVLKDASATAIYGAQGTNGVIVITTKRGKIDAPTVSYEFSTGFQQLPKKVEVMNLQEYATYINSRNSALGWGFDTRPEFVNPQYLGKGTDWQSELFRNAPMTSHVLSVRGGDQRTQYMLSGSYESREGIATGSKFVRGSFDFNIDNRTTDWLKIGSSLKLASINENVSTSGSSVINTALRQTPDIAVKNTDGSWGGAYNPNGWVNPTYNPLALAYSNKDDITRYQLWGNAYGEINFLKDFVLRNQASLGYSNAMEEKFNPQISMGILTTDASNGSMEYTQSLDVTLTNILSYNHTFSGDYNCYAMFGHESKLLKGTGLNGYRSIYPSPQINALSSADPSTAKNGSRPSASSQESYFARFNLGVKDKYIATGTIRYDGSSNFAPENRWVLSYSGALAWKINNESFLKDIKSINELKLKIGYGLTNNQSIRGQAYTSTLATVLNGMTSIAEQLQNVANKDVKWEQTKSSNIGLNASMFNDRLNFNLEFYNKQTDGLLMQVPLPLYSGTAIGWSPGSIDAPYVNVGSVNNKGFDLSIGTTNIKSKDFTWRTDLTVSHNINKVTKLNAEGASLNGKYSKTIEGRSIGEFYGYVVEGVYSTKEDLQNHARPAKNGVKLPIGAGGGSIWYGDLMFKDLNGDGIIDEQDQTFLGSPIPTYQIGLNNTFNYKNFDLAIFFTANFGNKVFNQLKVDGTFPGTSFGYFKELNNYAQLALKDPSKSNTDIDNVYVINSGTTIPGLRNDNTNDNRRFSDKYIEDGSFLRCKSIALGYSFPVSLLEKVHIKSLRAYVSVANAFIFTKYKGLDPEIGSWDPLNAGVDNGFYPQPRIYTFGINLTFNK